jgi:diadenosine tetraphosphate (Ap4A) HIT family hydrolase
MAAELPPREAIVLEESWRVAHAFDSALPGWLVAVPLRHVTSFDELSDAEASSFGPLVRRCSAALREVTGCSKTYLAFFAEAEGFAHLHVHLVPRMPWFGPDHVGPQVFGLLGRAATERVAEEERDTLARRLRDALAAAE